MSEKDFQANGPYPMPMIIERTPQGERGYDIFSRLLKDRIIFLGSEVNDFVANAIVGQLLFLNGDDDTKEITLYINSPGGSVSAGLAIHDTMRYIRAPVSTMCVGLAASMGAFLLCSGAKGRRLVLPNADIMIHQPLGQTAGQVSDMEIAVQHGRRLKDRLNVLMAEYTGQPYEKLVVDTDRNNFMTAEEAVAYGLVDAIIAKQPIVEKKK